MVRNLFKLFDAPNVGANDGLLLLVDTDRPKNLSVCELLIVEAAKGSGKLALVFLIEDDLGSGGAVVDFEHYSHRLLSAADHATHDDDLWR